MKTGLSILIVLGVIGLVGCSHPDEGIEVTIAPYERTDREEQMMHLAATSPTDVLMYKVTPGKVKMEKKIDHYHKGKIKDTWVESSGEYDGEFWLFRQWFIADEGAGQGGFVTMVED